MTLLVGTLIGVGYVAGMFSYYYVLKLVTKLRKWSNRGHVHS